MPASSEIGTPPRRRIRGLQFRGPRSAELTELPAPEPRAGWAVVEPQLVALCGTDLKLFEGTLHDVDYPLVPGHEWTGTVVHAPSHEELEGARVVGDNLIPCGCCPACARGATNLCAGLEEVGFTLPGACAERFSIPAANLRLLPASVTPEAACLAEPLAVAVHAVERARIAAGDSVAIFGAGAVGQLVAQAARACGAGDVLMIENRADRRAAADRLGFATTGSAAEALNARGGAEPDVAVEASGAPEAFVDAVGLVRPGGRVCQLGYGALETVDFAPTLVMLKEIDICGALSAHRSWDQAVGLLVDGRVDTACLLTHVFSLEDWRDAFDALRGDSSHAVRVALEIR